ncbi:hypothetical protein R83H12_02052 [Fibrobacteria bacterium R8-3-H12]
MHHTAAKYRPTPNPAPQGLASYGGSNNPAQQAPNLLSGKSYNRVNRGSDVPNAPDNSAPRSASPAAIFFNFRPTHNSRNLGNPPPPPYTNLHQNNQPHTAHTRRTRRLRRYTPQTSRQTNPSKKRESSTFAFLRICLPFANPKLSGNTTSEHSAYGQLPVVAQCTQMRNGRMQYAPTPQTKGGSI